MRIVSMRRAMMVMALVGGAALVASPAFAGQCCGSVGSLMRMEIWQDGPVAIGDNLVSIPRKSPINDNPGNPLTNGFQQLCDRCVDAITGDPLEGTATEIIQFDADVGQIKNFLCSSAAAPPWDPAQGVLIRPDRNAVCTIPGVECCEDYISYTGGAGVSGDNLFPVPLTFAGNDPQTLCDELQLQAGDQVSRFAAGPGNIASHICGSVAVWNLVLGEAVLVQPTSADSPPACVTIY